MCFKKSKNDNSVRKGLGRDFYSIFDDKTVYKKTNTEDKPTDERETVSLGLLFYNIFNDSVKSKNLTKEEKHRLYLEQNRKSIISAYNGDNVRELSLLYHCSQSDIIKILRESIAKNDKNCLANAAVGN